MPLIVENTKPAAIFRHGKILPAGTQVSVTPEKANELIASGDWRHIHGKTIRQEELAKRFHKEDQDDEE